MAKSSRFPRIVPRLPRGDELYDLLVADRHLSTICEKLKVLKFITPVNTREVREAFLAGEVTSGDPEFMYRHDDEDFDDLKSQLHGVPIRSDSELGHVFRRKRDELHDVLTMLQARGTSEFRERSRLLYGTTSREELQAINVWLKLPLDPPPGPDAQRSARDCCQFLRSQLSRDRLHATIRMRWGLSSSAAAGETSIAVRNDATFSALEMERIYVHEAETHILRYRNGERQPFRSLFYHGFPRHSDKPGNYLHTEEGLATLQEEFAGVLTNDRRRHLALRAVAVNLMDTEGLTFGEVFEALRDEYECDPDTSFSICER
ncbi:MAG: tyrosine/phenylalanine carboxypeptidase domain-containing protein, partial [Planctomycetota bacterium]